MNDSQKTQTTDFTLDELSPQQQSEYLKNKREGGRNFEKGHTFENRFAVSKIAERISTFIEKNSDAEIKSQSPGFFVDDLVITNNQQDSFCWQCKNSNSVSWGNGKKGSIAFDFCHEDKKPRIGNLELTLVVPTQSLAETLNQSKTYLPSCTKVTHFPDKKLLELIQDGYIRDPLTAIAKSEQPDLALLNQIARLILATWSEQDGNAAASIIFDECNNLPVKLLRSKRPNSEAEALLRPSVRSILTSIPNLEFKIERGYLHFFYLGTQQALAFDCFSEKFNTVQDWIEREKPTEFEGAFERILNTWSDD